MGFVVIITMISYGQLGGALVGLFGALCGSVISTRIMQHSCRKAFPEMEAPVLDSVNEQEPEEPTKESEEKPEVKEEDASNSLLDLFDSYGADYFKDPKNLIKLGVMFVVTVGVLVTIFVLLGMYLNGDK